MTLELRGVSVEIAGRRIVSDVELRVPTGQFVGLLGPNGSGKSTVLKTIYRTNRLTSGQVLLDGDDLLAMAPREAARRVAVVPQESVVEFDFTVMEIVMIGRTPHKRAFQRDSELDRALAVEALARVGGEDFAERSFNTLSGGERQRVLLARALAQGSDHLILDEPTSHLDVRYQIEILELVTELGLTVLAAIHDLNLAALFCDSVSLLCDGRIVTDGPPGSVITSESVRHAFGADVLVAEHPEMGVPYFMFRRSSSEGRRTESLAPQPQPGTAAP